MVKAINAIHFSTLDAKIALCALYIWFYVFALHLTG